jgi:hypothetical protein
MRFTNLATGLVLVACAACSSAPEPVATPMPRERRVTHRALNEDVKVTLEQIARQGKVSIILDSGIHGRLSISLNEMEPVEALMAVAKTFDLRVKEEAPGLYRVSPAP